MIRICSIIFLTLCTSQGYSQQWVWMSGDDNANQVGVYGALGVPDATNMPGSRVFPARWQDAEGNFWIFGGTGNDADGLTKLNDLWMYDTSDHVWVWMGGSSNGSQSGVYGTMQVPDPTNWPGSRQTSGYWTDDNGNFWLMGGYGYDASGNVQLLNDLWRYNVTSGIWTWISGSDIVQQQGAYGTQGVASATNTPGAREWNAALKDEEGNFWLFGGRGFDAFGANGSLNDLWMFDPQAMQWTWISGSNTTDQLAVYGTLGVPSIANIPGARVGSAGWIDTEQNLWIMGGMIWELFGSNHRLNDLWKYSIATSEWTWISGSQSVDQSGIYGTQGVPSSANVPGARSWPACWVDEEGNLRLLGGQGRDIVGSDVALNDVWKFDVVTGQWSWESGSTSEENGIYGTLGVPNSTNHPGSRFGAITFVDAQLKPWIFGGIGIDATGYSSSLNDLWTFDPNALGVSDETKVDELLLAYPNPSEGVFYLNLQLPETLIYTVTNEDGKIVKSGETSGRFGSVDISEMPEGLYYLNIHYGMKQFSCSLIRN